MQNNNPVFLLSSSQVIVFASISRMDIFKCVCEVGVGGQGGFCKKVGGRGWALRKLPVIYIKNSLQLPPSQ